MNKTLAIIGGVMLAILITGVSGLIGYAVGYIFDLIFGGVNTMLIAYVFAGVGLLSWLTYVIILAAGFMYAKKKADEFDEEFDRKWKGFR
ncbi:hypothetical protein [Halalkalibacterium ligniniphilum]|uniref:hypothetical protein n=1 Tax=Halalkalibacterium ligniniphilum TaxID=1134413 RepID=UPI00034505D0|nr:hypothetical protein [Halalkalibacterium ligniniphilum]